MMQTWNGFRPVAVTTDTVKVQSNASGFATASYIIPGIYNGNDATASNGRFIERGNVFPGNWTPGDAILNVTVSDPSGVLTSIASSFPHYPILSQMLEPGSQGPAVYLTPDDPTGSLLTNVLSSPAWLCSQLVITANFQKAQPVVDTFFINLRMLMPTG